MERRHIIDASPLRGMDVPPDNPSRSRVLSDDELRAVYRTCVALRSNFGRICALLCLTGQRPHEIAGLQWSWIKADTIEFPAEIAKNKRAWVLPIGNEARKIIADIPRLSEHYLFPATKKARPTTTVFNDFGRNKARLNIASGVTNWQLRDLRRTVATNLQRLGVKLEVTESLLNHVGSRAGIVGIYQVWRFMPEARDAALTYERFLTSL
jgi:integrase